MLIKRRNRQRGVTTVALVLFLAFFALVPLAIFGFELARYLLMQAQLQACADAAALAGTAALASSPTGRTIAEQHELAMTVAAQTFEQNSILQTRFRDPGNLSKHLNIGWDTSSPPIHSANLNIRLLDQQGNPQATGSRDATTMRVEASYTDKAIFAGNFFPTGFLATCAVFSDGGLPQLDLFLCFDVSGSMDDQTPVTLVRRQWNGVTQQVDYVVVQSNSIYPLCRPPKEGTGFNAMQPQNLSYASYGSPSNRRTWIFSESVNPASNLLANLRANRFVYAAGSLPAPLPASATQYPLGVTVPEQGLPPGNFDPTNRSNSNGNSVNPAAYANGFTDMVMTSLPNDGGFTFPNLATCVEASRGNLENATVLAQSQGNGTINPLLPAPQPGYYQAYWKQVRATAQPIANSRNASETFFRIMNTSSNAHFGLETFADTAGTSPTSTYTGISQNIDGNWAHGGTQAFPLPFITLNQTSSNFQEVIDAVQGTPSTLPLGPTGKTNIADALKAAIDDLSNPGKARSRAKKAIVLFTDGIPNRPVDESTGRSQARAQASRARNLNIPIYTIGLSQTPDIVPQQDALLGDVRTTSQGIAALSSDSAVYIRVNDSSALNAAFQTIARSLVVLQQ